MVYFALNWSILMHLYFFLIAILLMQVDGMEVVEIGYITLVSKIELKNMWIIISPPLLYNVLSLVSTVEYKITHTYVKDR